MARQFVAASLQYARHGAAIVTAAPLSVSLWFYADSLINGKPFIIGDGADGDYFAFQVPAAGTLRWRTHSSVPADGIAVTTNTIGTGEWAHAMGVETSTTSRSVRLNGGTAGTNTTSVTPSGFSAKTSIGADADDSDYFDGRVAEVAVWDVALSDDEQTALSKGLCPLLIRPQSLVAYWPLFGNDASELDRWKNRYDLTLTNTPTKAVHTRMFYPHTVAQ